MGEIKKCYSYTIDLGYEEEPENVPSVDDIRAWIDGAMARQRDTFTTPDAVGVEAVD